MNDQVNSKPSKTLVAIGMVLSIIGFFCSFFVTIGYLISPVLGYIMVAFSVFGILFSFMGFYGSKAMGIIGAFLGILGAGIGIYMLTVGIQGTSVLEENEWTEMTDIVEDGLQELESELGH